MPNMTAKRRCVCDGKYKIIAVPSTITGQGLGASGD